jgi:hypothetical protein
MPRIPLHRPKAKNPSQSLSPSDAPDPGEALRALGITNPGTVPDSKTAVADLLLYALTPIGGSRPDHGIVLGVAAELDTLAMFVEGPLSVTLELMARRIRMAVDLARRMAAPLQEVT